VLVPLTLYISEPIRVGANLSNKHKQ